MSRPLTITLGIALIASAPLVALAASAARDTILSGYAAQAGGPLSADRGKAFFLAQHSGGKPDTPSCSTCHTTDPRNMGRTRVGKAIDPMAVSRTPARFTDPAKVEKWFGRNCNTVLGRDCTAQEKGDIIAFFTSL